MRHKKAKFQLNRFTSWREATLKSLAKNLLIHQSIKTTRARARAVIPLLDKLITLGKLNTLSARRQAYKILGDHKLVSLLFSDIAARFSKRPGGYLRIMNLSKRRGDNAQVAILELVEIKKKEKRVKKEKSGAAEGVKKEGIIKEEAPVEPKTNIDLPHKEEKHPAPQKPSKKFLGGIKNIFKKERDSL